LRDKIAPRRPIPTTQADYKACGFAEISVVTGRLFGDTFPTALETARVVELAGVVQFYHTTTLFLLTVWRLTLNLQPTLAKIQISLKVLQGYHDDPFFDERAALVKVLSTVHLLCKWGRNEVSEKQASEPSRACFQSQCG
jgi:hypothetical protein